MPVDLRMRYDESVRRRAAELFADGHGYYATVTNAIISTPQTVHERRL